MAYAILDDEGKDHDAPEDALHSFPRREVHAARTHVQRFWTAYVRLGFCVLGAESAAVVVYLYLTPHDGNRGILDVIGWTALAVALAGVSTASFVGSRSWRAGYNFGVTLGTGIVVAVTCSLDGGIDSPLVYLTAVPIVSAALVLSTHRVLVCAIAGFLEITAVTALDGNVTSEPGLVVLAFAFVTLVGLFGVLSARGRERLQREDDHVHLELARMAETDLLTGCLNNGTFFERLSAEVYRFERYNVDLSLIIADVDLFKSFNDQRGHLAGDRVLADLGALFRTSARKADVVARIGGDEFAVILPSTSLAVAEEVAARLKGAIVDRADIEASMSFGVATCDRSDPTVKRLFRDADRALYQAKDHGRGGIVSSNGDPGARQSSASARSPRTAKEDCDRMEHRVRIVERENAETGAFTEAMLGAAPIGLCFVDRDYRIQRMNAVLAKINGMPLEQQIGRRVPDVVAPALWLQLEPVYRQVIENGEVAVVDDVVTESDTDPSRLRYWHSTFYPVFVGEDTVGLGVIAVDMTDRRELEDAEHRLVQSVVAALTSTVEIRDPYTSGHQASVALIAAAIGGELGLDPGVIKDVELAARIHDVGKVRIPTEILSRPGRLSDSEIAVVREHAKVGGDILASVDFPESIRQMVLQHHERADGSGYPSGLSKGEICIGARVIAVADVVDSMASARPYRPALGIEAALSELERGKGTLFDADVVDACLRLFDAGRLPLREEVGTAGGGGHHRHSHR